VEIPVDLASCRKSRRPCSIDPFPASQAEALDVEILLSSQGSRIANVEKSSIVYSFLAVLITFKSSESGKEVNPGSIEPFCYVSLVSIANVKRCTLSFSRFAPHHGQLFRPLSPIAISVTTVRRHDVALPSISAIVFTTPKPHGLTIVEPRVAYTRYPTGSTDCYSPAAVINRTLYPEPPMRKLHFHSSSTLSLFLFFF
jgi:hypothetical protein